MTVFLVVDFTILPEILQADYLISRFGMQIPATLLLFAFTYHKDFAKYQQIAILLTILVITFANYWLIRQSWINAQFAFSYEGTLLYTFFAFFVIRLSFKFGIIYVILSLAGFAGLVFYYPIYGVYNTINFGFVAMAQSICLVGLFALTRSFTQVDNLTAKLHTLSRIDQLTGLYNRRAYEQEGNTQFEQALRMQIPISIFLIDIDNFKEYNDTYGHQKGDDAIRIQAHILKSIFKRQVDIVGRFGGEEFIVIANNITLFESEKLAQKVLDAWAEEKIQHGKGKGDAYLSCSIGVVNLVPSQETSLRKIIGMSDKALYEAKNAGRNCYKFYRDRE